MWDIWGRVFQFPMNSDQEKRLEFYRLRYWAAHMSLRGPAFGHLLFVFRRALWCATETSDSLLVDTEWHSLVAEVSEFAKSGHVENTASVQGRPATVPVSQPLKRPSKKKTKQKKTGHWSDRQRLLKGLLVSRDHLKIFISLGAVKLRVLCDDGTRRDARISGVSHYYQGDVEQLSAAWKAAFLLFLAQR